jgi:hypothetical protein
MYAAGKKGGIVFIRTNSEAAAQYANACDESAFETDTQTGLSMKSIGRSIGLFSSIRQVSRQCARPFLRDFGLAAAPLSLSVPLACAADAGGEGGGGGAAAAGPAAAAALCAGDGSADPGPAPPSSPETPDSSLPCSCAACSMAARASEGSEFNTTAVNSAMRVRRRSCSARASLICCSGEAAGPAMAAKTNPICTSTSAMLKRTPDRS